MSPELFDPELLDNPRTKYSDCYALGMVIYEVLSGRVPFYQYGNDFVVRMVFDGKRPVRPEGLEGVSFVDDVWAVLERCWTHRPSDRPGIEDVLQCLEEASKAWTPISPQAVPSESVTHSPTWETLEMSTGQISAAIYLMKVANWDGTSGDITQVLTTAFEAGDYLECVKDLEAHKIDPCLYINNLEKVSSYLSQGNMLGSRSFGDRLPTAFQLIRDYDDDAYER